MPTGNGTALLRFGEKIVNQAKPFVFDGYLGLVLVTLIITGSQTPTFIWPAGLLLLGTTGLVTLLMSALGKSKNSSDPVLIWTTLALVFLATLLLTASMWRGIPQQSAVARTPPPDVPKVAPAKLFGTVLVVPKDATSLPAEVTAPVDSDGDRFQREVALLRRPSLIVEGATIQLDGHTDIAVNTLDLRSAKILIGSSNLRIEARRILVDRSEIRSFADSPSATGRSAGNVTLIVHEPMERLDMHVFLTGEPGRPGNRGRDGAAGRDGAPGENASPGPGRCDRPAVDGGAGQAGEPGGDGGPGRPGGNNGSFTLIGSHLLPSSAKYTDRAKGGEGGPPGRGGEGGRGGPGGLGSGICPDGRAGPDGARGAPGRQGPAGPLGSDVEFRSVLWLSLSSSDWALIRKKLPPQPARP